MRAHPHTLDSSYLLFFPVPVPAVTSHPPSRILLKYPSQFKRPSIQKSLKYPSQKFNISKFNSSNTDSSVLDDDDDVVLLEEVTQSLSGDGVFIEVKKLGRNSRRIRSKIEIDASLDTVWSILTDYEKLAEFVPNLAVSQVVEKKDNFVRLYQIAQQNLTFGIKFNAKGVLDCYEKDLEIFPSLKKRDIEFKMIEGDFQLFEGKWSIEQLMVSKNVEVQLSRGKCDDSGSSISQSCKTTLSYSVDVRPKLWLPVRLVEGRLCNEMKTNLSCIREAAKKKLINEAMKAH